MDQNRALQILIEGVNAAQKRGAYTLNEAGLLLQAVDAFGTEKKPDNKKKGK